MTKKLEEEFNLPPLDDVRIDVVKTMMHGEAEEELDVDEIQNDIVVHQGEMAMTEKVDAALPLVDGMDTLEREMDEYAERAMETFQELVDLGKNVEDRHVAPIYDSASKMLTAGLQAKQAKLDKKLKMVELQMRKQRLDMQEKELEAKLKAKEEADEDKDNVVEGQIIGDRSALLNDIMQKMKENDK
jgi:hypothetical protein